MPISSKKRKNSQLTGKFREIFVSANRELASFGMVFLYPPENFDERQLGTIFGIIKIFDTSQESSFIANLLASVIKKEYFSKPTRSAYDSFEASLRKANLALAEIARQGSVKWMGKINFAGGVLEKNNLHFSKLGNTAILLIRNGMIADIGAGMEEEPLAPDSHPLKTFSVISSGKVENGDCLIFTTSDLLEIFSLEEIRQNAARFTRDEFPDILSASLTSNSELSGCIVLNILTEEEMKTQTEKKEIKKPYVFAPPPPTAPFHPPGEAINRPENIPRVDSPAVSPSVAPISKKEKLYISETDEIIPKQTLGRKISIVAKNVRAGLQKKLFLIWKKIAWPSDRFDRRRFFRSFAVVFLSLSRLIQRINWQNNRTRLLTAGGAIVILIAVYFSWHAFLSKKNASDSQAPAPPSQSAVPAAAPNDINLKNIDTISEIAPLSSDSRELLLMSDALFILAGDQSIAKINPSSGELENNASGISSGKFQLAATMLDLNTIFILTADRKIISFTPSNKKFQENNITLPDNLNATDIKTYLTYIYFLDSAANQIYRYPRAEGGFGDQQNWLKAGSDVKNSTSFSINDDLFVASRNQIAPYLQGKLDGKINFENPNVPFAIEKIFTAPDLENIYILDNKNHRIAAYSKDGKIVAQYWNGSISGIKDFVVDEKNKSVYLQKTDSILKFSTE